MKIKKSMSKVVSGVIAGGVLAGGILISITNIASASPVTNNAANNMRNSRMSMNFKAPMNRTQFQNTMFRHMNGILEDVLSDQVKAGIITQDESNKVLEYMKNRTTEMRNNFNHRRNQGKTNLLDEIVSEGILTQEKANAIKDKMHEIMEKDRTEQFNERLNALIENGTIKKQNADKLQEVFNTLAKERKANFEKMKNMTKEERRNYLENIRQQHRDMLDKLVEDGTLSQKDLDAFRSIYSKRNGNKGMNRGMHRGMRSGFNNLNGTNN
ncbi:hypothetical protein CLTEP_05820 [Clostridium tepidiprofundi DSM 19306]|uniref:Uncharacterized protein n=1 Tax=Clostridium tepidiprofundi DSM 19306 TaxID=1121338 RepID=A0A151B674_9CLOT|nr:hypothetical protein [Clostridium tepidiprofundi]KYH35406.1 hypothetical protein CLTEP_05820 [Clostridium tepidiprofundi DSM 19306]